MHKKLFSVSDFAKFSRTTKATLLHYDRIGLLAPIWREKNNRYRYYSTGQLGFVNLIRTMQEFGLTLEEIKELKDQRTPEQLGKILMQVMGKIDDQMNYWLRSKRLLFSILNNILSVANVDEKAISIEELPAAPIIIGEPNDYSNGQDDYDALLTFYAALQEKYLDFSHPVWALFSKDRIKRGDWKWPDRYYVYNSKGRDKRPAGFYAIAYTRGYYGETDEMYKRLVEYIDANGYEICGNAYEEYPLNEISVSDDNNYLIRAMLHVRKKK